VILEINDYRGSLH